MWLHFLGWCHYASDIIFLLAKRDPLVKRSFKEFGLIFGKVTHVTTRWVWMWPILYDQNFTFAPKFQTKLNFTMPQWELHFIWSVKMFTFGVGHMLNAKQNFEFSSNLHLDWHFPIQPYFWLKLLVCMWSMRIF